jgi:hypothetical protein
MRRLGLLLSLTLAPAAPAEAQEPMTEASLRAMPPDLLSRRLLGESAALAFPLPAEQQVRGPDDFGRTSVIFLLRPRGSTTPGICEAGSLVVQFEPLGAPGPNTPLRLHSMDTSRSSFIVRDSAIARSGSWPDVPAQSYAQLIETQKGADLACAGIDPRQVQLVYADGAGPVARAVALVANLLDSARAGRTPVPARCQDEQRQPLSNDDCLRTLAALRTESLIHVFVDGCEGVDPRAAAVPDILCLRAWLWDQHHERMEIAFVFHWGRQELIRIVERSIPELPANY